MKKKDIICSVAITVVFAGIISAAIYRFIVRLPGLDSFQVKDVTKIELTALDGSSLNFTDLIDKDRDTYCLFFEPDNSRSSIHRGLLELKKMQAAGKQCLSAAVHDSLDELTIWCTEQNSPTVYLIEKIDFYRHFLCAALPVMAVINKGEVKKSIYYALDGEIEQ
ncbi:MAG: hypothetical protein KAW12_22475 [Candidatus Aminicenantes bacterium]|nr:hypothetical protein [Candidatus Aminicenantes bacterium]